MSLTNRFENAEQQRSAIEDLGSVVLSETAFIDVSNFHDVQSIGEHLLQTLVRPRRLKAQPVAHQLTLRASVEHYFFAQNLLGVKATDLAEHKVVKRFAIAGSEQLFADFAYRNGVMRFAQLLDLNVAKSSLSSKLEESCKKAVALDKAAKAYGVTARRFVLFRDGVDSDDNARAALNILRDYSDEQFDASSSKQLAEFYGQFAPPQLI